MTCGALTSVSFSDSCRRSAKRPASVNDGLSAKLHGAQRERYGNNKQGTNPGGPEHIYIGEQRGLVGCQPRNTGNGLSFGAQQRGPLRDEVFGQPLYLFLKIQRRGDCMLGEPRLMELGALRQLGGGQ